LSFADCIFSVIFSSDKIRALRDEFRLRQEDETTAVQDMPVEYKVKTQELMQSDGYAGLVWLVAQASIFFDLNEQFMGSVPCNMGLSVRAIELFPMGNRKMDMRIVGAVGGGLES
jgi:hypothetical protein